MPTKSSNRQENKTWDRRSLSGIASLVVLAAVAFGQESEPLRLVQTISLPDIQGRIDHFALDSDGQRLFMSALGNNSVEVIDLKAGKAIQTIRGLEEPQGVGYVNAAKKIFVANGGDGALRVLDGNSYRLLDTIAFSSDADNIRYDQQGKRVYVGYGDGALGIIDAYTGKRLGDIKLEGHPESFQLDASSSKIFVNVPHAGHIAVVDRDQQKVIARWPLQNAGANFPMALDQKDHRLYVVCRKPASLLVFDTDSGKQVTALPVVGDADDVFYDAASRSIYISGGEGYISVIRQTDVDHYEAIAKIETASGARTSFFAPDLGRLYLAVPRRGDRKAEIRVYEVRR
jgi:DNA-binding beta-propeller fold protein YncE